MPGPLFRTDTMVTIAQISAQEVYVGAPSGRNAVGSRPIALEKSTTSSSLLNFPTGGSV